MIFRDYGAQVTGGQMYPDHARMDFALEGFKAEMAPEIERRVNEELAKDYPVRVRFLPRDEAFAIPDLIRTKINLLPPGIETIRIVEIIGLDLQADGGTHVAHTGEVGAIRILKTENKGKINKRMEIALAEKRINTMAETTEKKTPARKATGKSTVKTKRAPNGAPTLESVSERKQVFQPVDRADARGLPAAGGRDPALVG